MIREHDRVVGDLYAAMEKMQGERRTEATLRAPHGQPPYIQRDHFGGHYDRWFAADRYPVAEAVVREMRSYGFLEGTPAWGYTDRTKLRLTDAGRSWYWYETRRRREAAEGEQIVDQTPHTD